MRLSIKQAMILSVLPSLILVGCSAPTQKVQVPSPTAVSEVIGTSAPSAAFVQEIIVPEDTPTPVATPDLTETAIRSFAATADAVSTDVAAQGGGWPEVQGTLIALGVLEQPEVYASPTPTPLPFPVNTQEVQVSWGTAIRYSFANSDDLLAAQQAYEQYFDFISFQSEPPPDDVEEALAELMVKDGSGIGPFSCLFADMLSGISGKASQGRYVRLTPIDELVWDDTRVYLDVGPSGIEVAVGWVIHEANVELVEIRTGNVLKRKLMGMAGTAHMTYVSELDGWLLDDDNGGFYCEWISFFE